MWPLGALDPHQAPKLALGRACDPGRPMAFNPRTSLAILIEAYFLLEMF